MSTGLKVWLWFVFVMNIISTVVLVPGAVLVPLLWVSVLLEVVILAGTVMILFMQKKLGFYLICAGAVAGLIINIIAGGNLVQSVISAVLMPLITYLLMKGTWDQFA